MAGHSTARRYASPQIAERRRRILDEVKKLIGERGAEGFTLRDLGQRAGVSITTIYNVFGDKESVIAHALREFDSDIPLRLPDDPFDLQGYLEAIAYTSSVVIAHRSYALALADLYFSNSLSETLFEVIRSFPLHVFSAWRERAAEAGLLAGRMTSLAAESCYDNMEWGAVKDWGAGRNDDAELVRMRQRHFLVMVMADGAPAVAERAGAMLAALDGSERIRLV